MRSSRGIVTVLTIVVSFVSFADAGELLWQIGEADNDTAEFALGPKDFSQFKEDGFFVVGQSDPKRDWPYAHPGTVDQWAGGRGHTFTIVFGLKTVPADGESKLILDLVDTHANAPARLRIDVNEHSTLHNIPQGAGDESIRGEPAKGREHRIEVTIPAGTLQADTNTVTITTLLGSWLLYDWVGLETPADAVLGDAPTTFLRDVHAPPVLVRKGYTLKRQIEVTVNHSGEPRKFRIGINDEFTPATQLEHGTNTLALSIPMSTRARTVIFTLNDVGLGQILLSKEIEVSADRKWELHLLHHSHNDIGYTRPQPDVEKLHWKFFKEAIELSKKTANNPPESQFKWNSEVLWPLDGYLEQASEEDKKELLDAIAKGWFGIDGIYGNELTGLCRPEELFRLCDKAQRLRDEYGLKIDAAMISDVPGYTWGTAAALAHNGIRYFSVGPNYIPSIGLPHGGFRVGYTLKTWGDRPFYWVSPSGKQRVLFWMTTNGYSWFHSGRGISEERLFSFLNRLQDRGYDYDMVQVRYTIHGDNGPPDPTICDFVKKWNAKYAYPKLIMNTTSRMFHEFEERYGDRVPEVRGDFTPYWEDGAASSARETTINRNAAERLVQAEALWAMLDPDKFPDKRFYDAWKDVLLYDEHTWGANCSISQPDSEFTKTQWAWKRERALGADKASKALVADAVANLSTKARPVKAVDVYNTCSWPRTDLVVLPANWQLPVGIVHEAGQPPQPDSQGVIDDVIASQRLSTGEVAFVAKDIPPFGSKRYVFSESMYAGSGHCDMNDGEMRSGELTVRWNPLHGGIVRLEHRPLGIQLADFRSDKGLNQYFYVPSLNQKDAQGNGPVTSRAKEGGPVVASVLIESDAPGCRKLQREIRLVAGLNRVDIINTLDKKQIRTKEGVHFGFAFNVPEGVVRMDVPWAVVRPELDQMPGANKNFFTVQRWVDISNEDYGVTWATVDAPLVELGSMCAEDPHLDASKPWLKTIEPTQKLFSYVMNNYWRTNYKADQEGLTTFRYSIQPHGKYDPVAAQRFGIERSQPLIAVPVDADAPQVASRLRVEPDDVIVTSLKPSRDGEALMVRLFNTGDKDRTVRLNWSDPVPARTTISSPAEKPGSPMPKAVTLSPWEIVTLRAELPSK